MSVRQACKADNVQSPNYCKTQNIGWCRQQQSQGLQFKLHLFSLNERLSFCFIYSREELQKSDMLQQQSHLPFMQSQQQKQLGMIYRPNDKPKSIAYHFVLISRRCNFFFSVPTPTTDLFQNAHFYRHAAFSAFCLNYEDKVHNSILCTYI